MVVTFLYLFLILVIAIGRLYYSRFFLISSYLFNILWIYLGYILKRKRKLKFILLSSSSYNETLSGLLLTDNIEWIKAKNLLDNDNLHIDGIVIHSLEDLNQEQSQYVIKQTLKGIPVYHVSDIYEIFHGKLPIKYFYEEFLGSSYRSPYIMFLKRLFDLTLSFVLLPFVALLSIVISIIIKIDSKGPIFFKQDRVGQGGRIFKLIKFRTMYIDAESNGPQFAVKNDPRITRVGRILRKLHLDELPQIWNIIKGEMSFVGPRPEQAKFVEEFEKKIPFYNLRHLVKPGITGWAQIHQGYAAGLEETIEKLEYDLYYIKNMSIWLDLIIILKTISIILTRRGAR
jgi:exopolysaccharide biosynthesis polyprenyl glycosylphosphotransferase